MDLTTKGVNILVNKIHVRVRSDINLKVHQHILVTKTISDKLWFMTIIVESSVIQLIRKRRIDLNEYNYCITNKMKLHETLLCCFPFLRHHML